MAIFEHGIGQCGIGRCIRHNRAVIRIEEKRALLAVPSIILAGFDEVDFLDVVLADIADDQASVGASKEKRKGLRKP